MKKKETKPKKKKLDNLIIIIGVTVLLLLFVYFLKTSFFSSKPVNDIKKAPNPIPNSEDNFTYNLRNSVDPVVQQIISFMPTAMGIMTMLIIGSIIIKLFKDYRLD